MNAQPFDEEMEDALLPWDGRWFVPKPAPGPHLVRLHQLTAKQLLRRDGCLTNWDARFLQTLMTQAAPPDEAQHYWLRRIEGATGEREAA